MTVLVMPKISAKIITVLMLTLCVGLLSAAFIQPDQARQAAVMWLQTQPDASAKGIQTTDLLVYTGGAFVAAETSYQPDASMLPSVYLLKTNGNGFVLLSADDNSLPVLAYAGAGDISVASYPPNFLDWVDGYALQIEALRNSQVTLPDYQMQWQNLLAGNQYTRDELTRSVQPLISTNWDQGWPYNELCPADNAGPGGRVYAGCVATAMGMVMKYWNHPATGVGSNSYYAVGYGYQSANFGATTYLWDEMPDALGSSNIPVATLLYHCGVAVNMDYAPDGSGAQSADAADAMVDNFRYPNASIVSRNNYSAANWNALLKAQIDNGSPMYYSGSGTGGHAFVIDGYDTADYFHFNFGWSGSYNGYYYVNNINPGSSDFSQWGAAIINSIPENYTIANTKVRMHANNPTVGENFTLRLSTNPILGSWNVNHYEFDLLYDNTFVNYTGYNINSTISSSGTVTVTNPEPGVLSVSWNGTTPLIGGGDLISFTFTPIDQGEYLFDISDMKYNTSPVSNTMYLMVNVGAPVATLAESQITMSNVMHLGYQQIGTTEIRTSYLLPSWNVTHYQFHVVYDHTKLEFVGLATDGTLSAGSSPSYLVNTPGNVTINCDASSVLSTSGVLVKVSFRAIGNTSSLTVTHVSMENFYYNSTAISSLGGANFILAAVTSVDDELIDAVPHLTITPNPVQGSALLSFSGKAGMPAQFRVFNLKGQLVKHFTLEPSVKSVDWDATDAQGRKLASGVYFVAWQQGNTKGQSKILITK